MGRPKLPKGESAFRKMFQVYKRWAKKKDRIFELSIDQFRGLTKSSCFYCGDSPNTTYNASKRYNGYYIYNGIDRVNNSKGYVLNNCVSCCKTCNTMKSNMDLETFYDHIKKIYEWLELDIPIIRFGFSMGGGGESL